MIEVNDLSFSYGGNAAIAFPNFKCNRGEKLLLLGDSGTGKTPASFAMWFVTSQIRVDECCRG